MNEFTSLDEWNINRRRLLAAAGLGIGAGLVGVEGRAVRAQTSTVARASNLIIDLTTEPPTLDPATTYEANGWSIVHSVYDSLLQYGPTGEVELLLAESWEQVDPTTIRVTLRPGITFHNGEPLTTAAVAFSLEHLLAEETASQVAGNFRVIEELVEIDDLTFELRLSAPAPWLPAQIAAWLAILPPEYAATEDFARNPIGTGPYQFRRWTPGTVIELDLNPEYLADSAKGVPIADSVSYRFVSDASTRVADLLSGQADIVQAVPVDQISAVEDAGQSVIRQPLSGSAFIIVPNTVAPFDNSAVRQALNLAVDVESIIDALDGGDGSPLANVLVPSSIGYDPDLAPYAYDPDQARVLLEAAGYGEGFETSMDVSALERLDVAQAVVAQLGEVGIDVALSQKEPAVFNAPDQWSGEAPDATELRLLSWRPLFDPWTLLGLVFSNTGFLSRFDDPTFQDLFDAFSTESDPEQRSAIATELGQALHDNPAAIYLYDLTARYGVSEAVPPWTPRPDEYLIATYRAEG